MDTCVFLTKYGHIYVQYREFGSKALVYEACQTHMQAKGSVIHSFLDGQYSQSIVSILLRTSMNVNLFSIV